MSLQTRLSAVIQAIGADIKTLKGPKTLVADTPDPTSIAGSASDNAVQWVRASDGAWVAKVDPYLSGSIQTLEVTSRAKTDGQQAQAILKAEENGTFNAALGLYFAGEYSTVEVTQADSSTAEPRGSVVARSGANVRKIIDSAGGSDLKREITTVTQLPSSPYDGQEVYYNTWTIMGDVIWHLRYTAWAASGHKWLVLGGYAVRKQIGGTATRTSTNNAYEDSAAGVLSILAPSAGDYEVEWGCAAYWNTTANGYASMAVGIGAFTTIPDNSRMKALFAPSAGHTEYGPVGKAVLTDVAANQEIRIRFSRRVATGTANFQEPFWMSIKPIRLSRLVV